MCVCTRALVFQNHSLPTTFQNEYSNNTIFNNCDISSSVADKKKREEDSTSSILRWSE